MDIVRLSFKDGSERVFENCRWFSWHDGRVAVMRAVDDISKSDSGKDMLETFVLYSAELVGKVEFEEIDGP